MRVSVFSTIAFVLWLLSTSSPSSPARLSFTLPQPAPQSASLYKAAAAVSKRTAVTRPASLSHGPSSPKTEAFGTDHMSAKGGRVRVLPVSTPHVPAFRGAVVVRVGAAAAAAVCVSAVLYWARGRTTPSDPGRPGARLSMAAVSASISQAVPPVPQTVALVTGANKGIGKELARALGSVPNLKVVMGCRDAQRGAAAAQELQAAGCDVVCHHVDLTDPDSATALRDFVAREFGRLDVLVNNAAICFNDPTLYGRCAHTPFERQADITVSTNFFGTLAVTRAMLPLLRAAPSPRIINVASAAGRLAILKSPEKRALFTSPTLQVPQLEALMREFVRDVEGGVHAERGWPNTCYGMSKLAIIALTRVLARQEPRIMVNSVDPGYCATDQNAHQGFRSAEQGARTPALLAVLPESEFLSGMHFFDEAEIQW